jgi:hypothetical protein
MELFVLSPYFDAGSLLRPLSAGNSTKAVVTSSLLLPSEQARLVAADPMISVHDLNDGFADEELGRLDDAVTADIDTLAREADAAELVNLVYTELFMRTVRRRRNCLAAERIRARYGPAANLWVCAGPNIDVSAWESIFPEAAVHELPRAPFASEQSRPCANAATANLSAGGVYATYDPSSLARTRLFSPSASSLLLDLSDVRATLAKGNVARAVRWVRAAPARWHLQRAQRRLRRRLRRGTRDIDPAPLRRICDTATLHAVMSEVKILAEARHRGARGVLAALHGFSPLQALAARFAGLPMIVAQDGYLPINYPLAVYGVYRGSLFLWWSEASRRWGAKHGLEGVACPPLFPAPEQPSVHSAADEGKRILAMPNHGGDWTSLIFRSDIDRFVAGIVATARLCPEVAFRIRTHPTMVLEAHDGVNAADRLRRFVKESGVDNVSFSNSPLEADIDWATFAVSEYSLALIEFVARNRGGIATFNPTGRRNFFLEFTARGVPHATDAAGLAVLIDGQPKEGSEVIRTLIRSEPSPVSEALQVLTGSKSGESRP